MAKLDPQEYLESLKATKKEANGLKSSILQYEKTASKHTKTLSAWVTDSKVRFDGTVAELKTRFNKESQAFKANAKTESEEVESIRKEAKSRYNRFNQTYTAAMSKRNGVEVKHAKVLKLADEVTKNANDISKYHTKAGNDRAAISELLQNSRKNDQEIGSIHQEAQKVSEEIKNTYAITLDTTMAGTLVDRRNALKKRTERWERLYLSSIYLIIIVVIILTALAIWGRPLSFLEVLTERLVFVTPLVLIAFVFGKQYNHERKLYEEYAFKAATAQSLRGYTVLLNGEFKDIEKARLDILDFTIEAMKGIYDRTPLIQDPSTIHVMLGNNIAKFEAKLEEKVQNAVREAAKETGLSKDSGEVKVS